MNKLKLLALLLCISMQAMAQISPYHDDDFYYWEENHVTIAGVYYTNKEILQIPSSVTSVSSEAFSGSKAVDLIINDANVEFDIDAFKGKTVSFNSINMGSKMNEANMKTLVKALGAANVLLYKNVSDPVSYSTTFKLEGLDNIPGGDIQWYISSEIEDPDEEDTSDAANAIREKKLLCSIMTEEIPVTLPAALVGDQTFGNATVYGRFEINTTSGIATTCVNKTFRDTDTGSNLLFYAATDIPKNNETNEYEIKVERVLYIKAGEGLLMHNANGTSWWAELERYDDDLPNNDIQIYNNNMFKGTLAPTTLFPTEEINSVSYSNLILLQGSFHPITGGTLGANRAYLQIPTATLNEILGTSSSSGKLSIAFPEESGDATSIDTLAPQPLTLDQGQPMYNLAGQKVNNSYKGIVIINGKKVKK